MARFTIGGVAREAFEALAELALEHRADPEGARHAIDDFLEESGIDLGLGGAIPEDEPDALLFFGAPLFSARISPADDFYGRIDAQDERLVWDAVEDGVAISFEAALAGEVSDPEPGFDFESVEVYRDDSDYVLSEFDWAEAPPDDPVAYRELMVRLHLALIEALDEID